MSTKVLRLLFATPSPRRAPASGRAKPSGAGVRRVENRPRDEHALQRKPDHVVGEWLPGLPDARDVRPPVVEVRGKDRDEEKHDTPARHARGSRHEHADPEQELRDAREVYD